MSYNIYVIAYWLQRHRKGSFVAETFGAGCSSYCCSAWRILVIAITNMPILVIAPRTAAAPGAQICSYGLCSYGLVLLQRLAHRRTAVCPKAPPHTRLCTCA